MLLAVLRCDRELRFQNILFLHYSRSSCIRWSAHCKSSRTATRVLRARPEMTSEPRTRSTVSQAKNQQSWPSSASTGDPRISLRRNLFKERRAPLQGRWFPHGQDGDVHCGRSSLGNKRKQPRTYVRYTEPARPRLAVSHRSFKRQVRRDKVLPRRLMKRNVRARGSGMAGKPD